MKRLGRRGRALGQTACDEDLLDDETKKQLLAGAGITSDVLEDMSVEERQGTLKAILASNPALLPTLTTDKQPAAVETGTPRSSRTRYKHAGTDSEAENVSGAGHEPHIVHADSSDSLSSHSCDSSLSCTSQDCPLVSQPGRQLKLRSPVSIGSHGSPAPAKDRVQVPQMMAVDRVVDEDLLSTTPLQKPAQLVQDSDEEKADTEEETQPYDVDCLVANSQVSPQSLEQELLIGGTIPETQTVDSNPETNSQDESGDLPHLKGSIVKPVESSRTPETVCTASTSFRVMPPVGLEQDVPLTRIYRTHQNQEQTLWPSLYASSSVQEPGLYTDVIKLVLDIYMHRVCRAQKQSDQLARAWGKPVSSGCHVEGCLRANSARLQDEQAQDVESKRRRASRRRCPQNEGSSIVSKHRKYEEEEDDDFDLKLSQTLKQDLDKYRRLHSEKAKREVHDEVLGVAAVAACKQPQCLAIDELNEDMVGIEEDGNESDEWIPVKVTRGSEKRNRAVAGGSRQQTRSRLTKNKKREHGDNTESDNVTLSKKVVGASRKVKQVKTSSVEVDMSMDRCDFESMVTGSGASVQQKYHWSDEEERVDTSRVGAGVRGNHTLLSIRGSKQSKQSQGAHVIKVGRVDALDRTAEPLNTDVVVEEKLSKHHCVGNTTLAGLTVEMSNCNPAAGNSHSTEGSTTHGKLDALTVDVGSSQSSESLLDGQGNLYSTQLPPSEDSASTDSHLASVHRGRRRGENISRVRNIVSSRQTGQPAVGVKGQVRSQKDVKLSIGPASPLQGQGSSDIRSRPSLKQMNRRNSSRNNDASDDRGQVKAVSNQVNDQVVMTGNSGDNNCDVRQDSKPLSSNRRLKRCPVVLITEEKRRKLDYSSALNKSNSYAVTETCSTIAPIVVESNFDSDAHPLPPTPGHTKLSQGDAGSVVDSTCPICGQYFQPSKLEAHASSCGEDAEMAAERDSDDVIRCLKCAEKILKENIKEHQIHCVQMDVPGRRLTRSNRE